MINILADLDLRSAIPAAKAPATRVGGGPLAPQRKKELSPASSGPGFATRRKAKEETGMPEQRIVYGCVGGDRPEAQPYIDEVDGALYYTCPECRKALEELAPPPPRE
jgi:hypothetical protein